MQRRERNKALEVGEHRRVHTNRRRVLGPAVDDAVDYRRRRLPARLAFDGPAHLLQRGGVRLFTADAFDFAGPERLARQRLDCRVEQGELDARRAAIQYEDRLADL